METTRILVKNQIVTPLPFKIDKYSDTTDFKDIVICQKVDYPETYYIEKYENDFIGSSMIDITKCREGDMITYNTVRVVHDISFYHYELGSNETYDNMKPVSVFSIIETATGSPIYNAIIGNKTTFENSYNRAFGSYTHCTDDSLNKYYNETSKCFDFSNLKITAEFNKYATYFTIVDTTTGKTISSMTINQRYQTLFNTVVVNGVLTSTVNSPLQHYFDYCSDIAVSNSKTYFQFGLIITDINPIYINGGNLKFVSASTMKDLLHGNLLLKGVRFNKDFIINMKVVDKTLQPDIDDQSDITKKKQLTDSAEVEKEIEDEYINCGSKDIDPEDIAVYVEIDKDNLYPLDISINDGKVKIKDTYFAADRNLYLGSKRQFLYKQMYIDHRSNILKLDGTFRTGWNKDKYLLFKNGYLVNRSIYWVRVSDMENIYGDKLIFSASSFKPGDRIDLFYIESRDDMDLVPYNRDVYMSSKIVTSYKNNQKVVKVPYPNKVYPRGQKQFFIFTKEGIFLDNRYDYTLSDDKEYVSFKKDVLPNTGDFVTFVFPYVRSNFEVDGEYEDALSGEKAGTKFFFSYSVLDLPKRKLFFDKWIGVKFDVSQYIDLSFWYKKIPGNQDATSFPPEYEKYFNLPNIYVTKMNNMMGSRIEYDYEFDDKGNLLNFKIRDEGFQNIESMPNFPNLNVSKCTDYNSIFSNLRKVKSINLNWLSAGKPISTFYMFLNCESLQSIDLTPLNTKNLKNAVAMFSHCYSLKEINLKQIETSNIVFLQDTFWGCISLSNLISDGLDWGNLANMHGTFNMDGNGNNVLKKIDLSTPYTCNSLKYMYLTFSNCNALEEIDFTGWDFSNCEIFNQAFMNIPNLKTIKGVIDMKSVMVSLSNDPEIRKHMETYESRFGWMEKGYYVWKSDDQYWGIRNMFASCPKLTGVKIKNPPSIYYTDKATFEKVTGLNSSQYTIVS